MVVNPEQSAALLAAVRNATGNVTAPSSSSTIVFPDVYPSIIRLPGSRVRERAPAGHARAWRTLHLGRFVCAAPPLLLCFGTKPLLVLCRCC